MMTGNLSQASPIHPFPYAEALTCTLYSYASNEVILANYAGKLTSWSKMPFLCAKGQIVKILV